MPWTATEIAEFERLVNAANTHFERFRRSSLHTLLGLLKTKPLPSSDAVKQAVAAIPENKKDQKYRAAINYLRKNYPGLDTVQVGAFAYKGFSGTQNERERLARAQLGVSRCLEMINYCRTALGKVVANTVSSANPGSWNNQQRKSTELFQRWFDNKRTYTSVDRVRAVFNNMHDSLRTQNWEIVLYGTPEDPDPEGLGGVIADAFAFVVPDENAYRIYLGALFWVEGDTRIDVPTTTHAKSAPTEDQWRQEKKVKRAMDAAIVTTLHELCHVRAISVSPDITDVQPNPYDVGTCKQRAQSAPNLALTNAENYAQFASALWMEKHFF